MAERTREELAETTRETVDEWATWAFAGLTRFYEWGPENTLTTWEKLPFEEKRQWCNSASVAPNVARLREPEGERIEGCEIGTAFIHENYGGDSVTVKLPPGGSLHKMLGHRAILTILRDPEEPEK